MRGLYYHHFNEVLGDRAAIEANPIHGIDEKMHAFLPHMSQGQAGGKAFMYRYGRAHDSPLDSVWFMQFHERYHVFAHTASCAP